MKKTIWLILTVIMILTIISCTAKDVSENEEITASQTLPDNWCGTPDPITTTDSATTTPNTTTVPTTTTTLNTTTVPVTTTNAVTTTTAPITTTSAVTTTSAPVTTTTPTTTPSQPGTLSQAQLEEIQNFLNDSSNNGFVVHNNYTSADEINLNWVFYDGAGISVGIESFSADEKQAVLAAGGWNEFFNPPIKIKRADANALLLEKCGLSLQDFRDTLYFFVYVESYDAYYIMHGDMNYSHITVVDGMIDQNNNYVVNYYITDFCKQIYTVTLRKTDKGYQFISNTYDPYAIHELSDSNLTVDGTKKTYKDQYITLSVPSDWLALEQHGADGTIFFFEDPTTERCLLSFYVTGSVYAIHRTEAEYLALFKRWGYENVNILSYTKEKISGYDCTKVVYSYTENGNAYIGTRYDNVITGIRMYEFDIDYPAAESERFAKVFESIMDSIVLKPC